MRKILFGIAAFAVAIACMGAQALENTRWQLVELSGKPVDVATERQRPYLKLAPENSAAEGFGGCNGFRGTYKLAGDTLRFQNIISTLRACADQSMNDREREFLGVLNATSAYKLTGKTLELSSGSDPLARFSAKE